MDINLKITPVEALNDNFNEAMGISLERAKELADILIPTLQQEGNLLTAIVKASEVVTNINELAFCGVMLGKFVGMMSNPFAAMTTSEGLVITQGNLE